VKQTKKAIKSYARKLKGIEGRIREWQEKERPGTTDMMMSKAMSEAILRDLCPHCEYSFDSLDKFCGSHEFMACGIGDSKTRRISQTGATDAYVKCLLKSWDLTNVWVRVTTERSEVEIGKRYGKLTVKNARSYIAKPFKKAISANWWVCQCDCDNYRTVRGHDLTTGNTKSCGCSQRGGDRKSNDYKNQILLNHDSICEGKRRKYNIGSATNPDGTPHKYPHEDSSRIGQVVDVIVIPADPDNSRYYIPEKCQECGGTIRVRENNYRVCDDCGWTTSCEKVPRIGNSPLRADTSSKNDDPGNWRDLTVSDHIDNINREHSSVQLKSASNYCWGHRSLPASEVISWEIFGKEYTLYEGQLIEAVDCFLEKVISKLQSQKRRGL
jgi:hypothetical protein